MKDIQVWNNLRMRKWMTEFLGELLFHADAETIKRCTRSGISWNVQQDFCWSSDSTSLEVCDIYKVHCFLHQKCGEMCSKGQYSLTNHFTSPCVFLEYPVSSGNVTMGAVKCQPHSGVFWHVCVLLSIVGKMQTKSYIVKLLCLLWLVVFGQAELEQYAALSRWQVTDCKFFVGKAPHEATILQSSMCTKNISPTNRPWHFSKFHPLLHKSPPFPFAAAGRFVFEKPTRDGVGGGLSVCLMKTGTTSQLSCKSIKTSSASKHDLILFHLSKKGRGEATG